MFTGLPKLLTKSLLIVSFFSKEMTQELTYIFLEFCHIIKVTPIISHFEVDVYKGNKKVSKTLKIKDIKELKKITAKIKSENKIRGKDLDNKNDKRRNKKDDNREKDCSRTSRNDCRKIQFLHT